MRVEVRLKLSFEELNKPWICKRSRRQDIRQKGNIDFRQFPSPIFILHRINEEQADYEGDQRHDRADSAPQTQALVMAMTRA
jgi:hypothetical protein